MIVKDIAKRLLLSVLFMLIVPFSTILAQDSLSITKSNKITLSQRDSILIEHIDRVISQSSIIVPRYKLYETQNLYNLIKLDTATGRIWQIQIGMNDLAEKMSIPINRNSLLNNNEELKNGRFELCPTKNMYNFVLIDTQRGFTYQVQWHTDPDKRFIDEID